MKAVNLLPDAKPSRAPARGPRITSGASEPAPVGLVLLAPLVVVLAVLVLAIKAGNTVSDRKAELQRVSAEKIATEQKAATLKPYGDFATLASSRVDTVVKIANSRFDWEQVLRDLSRAVPAEVTLDSIVGTVTSGVNSGGSGSTSSLRAALPAPALELVGCTRSQPAVADLMSRLRNIQGVTRVSLASSDKDKGGGGRAISDSAGGATTPCGDGSRPKFELVVFFENDAAGALPTGTAGTPAAAGPSGPTGAGGAKPRPASGGQTAAPQGQPASDTGLDK